MPLSENPTLEEIVNEIARLNNLIVDRGGSQTITPSTSNKVLSKGNYKGDITILGDSDLISSNIRSGKNIFNVQGTLVEGYKANISDNAIYSFPETTAVMYNTGYKSIYLHSPLITGSFRITLSIKTSSYGTGQMYYYLEHTNSQGSIIKTYPITGPIEKNGTFTASYDISNLAKGDILKFYAKTNFGSSAIYITLTVKGDKI